MEKAIRYNQGKVQLSYVMEATYAVHGLAKVLTFGAEKYARNNYQASKMPANEIIDSLLRHLTTYMSGVEIDEESGLPHVDLIFSNAMFLAYHHNGLRDAALGITEPTTEPEPATRPPIFDYIDMVRKQHGNVSPPIDCPKCPPAAVPPPIIICENSNERRECGGCGM